MTKLLPVRSEHNVKLSEGSRGRGALLLHLPCYIAHVTSGAPASWQVGEEGLKTKAPIQQSTNRSCESVGTTEQHDSAFLLPFA